MSDTQQSTTDAEACSVPSSRWERFVPTRRAPGPRQPSFRINRKHGTIGLGKATVTMLRGAKCGARLELLADAAGNAAAFRVCESGPATITGKNRYLVISARSFLDHYGIPTGTYPAREFEGGMVGFCWAAEGEEVRGGHK